MSAASDMAAAERILERCDELALISSQPDRLERVHLSPEHARANALVAEWMREAGLETWQDAAGNMCGRVEGERPGLPALLLGSHIDTVPDAGRYDGMLGVLLAIEVAARLRDSGRALPFALELVAFSDEEGTRFGNALSGSRALAGDFDESWWDFRDRDRVSFREAAMAFGLDPERIAEAGRSPESLVGYLEAHIEQGPYLEDADRALGEVTSIAGARRFSLTVTGMAGHAGGAPYDRRRDALVGASEVVLGIERIGKELGVIATVGKLQAFPGGVNVIPGRVEFSLDLRAEFDVDRDLAWQRIQEVLDDVSARRRLDWQAEQIYRADAVVCGTALREAVAHGIRATGHAEPMALYSKAGHDGMAVSAVTDIAMLFIRCAAGISHHPDESVILDDVAAALDAYEAAVLHLVETQR